MKKKDFPQPSDDKAYHVQRIIHVSINSQGLKTTVFNLSSISSITLMG